MGEEEESTTTTTPRPKPKKVKQPKEDPEKTPEELIKHRKHPKNFGFKTVQYKQRKQMKKDIKKLVSYVFFFFTLLKVMELN